MPSLILTRLLMNAYASPKKRWRRSCAFSQQAGRRQGAEKPTQCLPAARGGIGENGMPSPTRTRLFMNAYTSHKKRSRKSCACFDPLAANANCLQIPTAGPTAQERILCVPHLRRNPFFYVSGFLWLPSSFMLTRPLLWFP